MKALIAFCHNVSVSIEELWCILTPRPEWNMWPMPLGLDSTSFFFVFCFVLGDKYDHKLLLTRLSSFNLFGVVLFAFFFNWFNSSCVMSLSASQTFSSVCKVYFSLLKWLAQPSSPSLKSSFSISVSSIFLSLYPFSSTLHPAVFSTNHQHT